MSQEPTDLLDVTANRSGDADLYLGCIRSEIPRLLSLMDRDAHSKTFGCMDRTYWAWKFTDFPGARFQEGVCTMAFLYATPFEDNVLYQNTNLLRWITAGIEFWCDIQRSSGDFDEAYPQERSLAATAFTTFYLAEAYAMLGGNALSATLARKIHSSMERAGNWLIKNDETHGFLSNHLAAAAAALYHVHQITGDPRFRDRARQFIDRILQRQSSEGWYDEYGGADPGYQSHGSFYLARCYELSGDEDVAHSLERANRFLCHFVHPDLSIGGEYASRNTQTYYPAAFEMMAHRCGTATWIKTEMLPGIRTGSSAGLSTVDVYNYFPMLNNYVFAYLSAIAAREEAAADGPDQKASRIFFPKAGILKIRKPAYDLFVGLAKGGVIKLFNRKTGKLVFNDCGYIGWTNRNRLVSSQWFEPDREIQVMEESVTVLGDFYEVSRPVMTPLLFLGFRMFTLTLGRFGKISYWLKSVLVKALIYRKKNLDIQLRRDVTFKEEGINVTDSLAGSERTRLQSLTSGELFTTIHMGSSKYFLPNELVVQETRNMDAGFLFSGDKATVEVRVS